MRPYSSCARVEAAHLSFVGHVSLQGEVARAVRAQIHAYHGRALLGEQLRGIGADAAGGAGDHADLAVQAPHYAGSVLTKTFFTSV